ncbi:hypothetical protein [Avibacterium paragallinarum]|uniref:hypothetical protein n=1 Tax=Avibacterium paragallinarum TaxID=728 RepID=UPI00397BD453
MKKLYLFTPCLFWGVFNTAMASTALIQDKSHYENATLSVNYKGNIGEFSQLLAQKLGIGYYSFQANSSTPIILENTPKETISQLFEHINQQLKGQYLRFDILNDNVVLTLVGENTQRLEKPQFISEITYQAEKQAPFSNIEFQEKGASASEPQSTIQEIADPTKDKQATEKQSIGTEADSPKPSLSQ